MRFTNDSHSVEIGFTEEYSLIPVEAGLKWNLPVSTNSFKIYIGGGAGIYFGNRKSLSALSALQPYQPLPVSALMCFQGCSTISEGTYH